MRPSHLTLSALLVLPATALASVTDVLLYPGQASVTRQHSVELQPGSNSLRIESLPAGIRRNTLRVSIDEAQGALLGQTELQRIPLRQAQAPHIRELETRLQQINDELRKLADERESTSLRLDLASRTARKGDNPASATDFKELGKALEEDARQARASIREIDFAKRDLQAEKRQVKSELNRYRSGKSAANELAVSYHSEKAQKAVINLQYQTRDASWSSQYDARLSTGEGELSLTHKAHITQTTGEDWEGVDLRLATGKPNLGGNLPDPRPWILSPKKQAKAYSGTATLAADSAEMARSARPSEQAAVESEGMTQRFRVDGARDIDDGTRNQALTLSHYDMEANVTTQIVPSMSTRAYIHAKTQFDGEAALPSASVTLYQDGQYIGQQRLSKLAPGDDLEMAFGVDQRITVETIPEKRRRGDEGIISTSHVAEQVTRHDITNHHPRSVDVRVFERLPVSNDDAIEIEHHDITQPYSKDPQERRGVIVWDRTIESGQTESLRYGFTVTVPEGDSLPRSLRR